MTDFPATKKTFSQIVDGTTYMEAVNVNTAYNEVEAMQTFTGQLGSGNTQGYSAALLALLSGYQRATTITYKDADEVTAAAGAIVFEAAGKYRMRVNTTTTDIGWADIDTGAEADNTYYVYAVADAEATTFTFMISLSATTPTGATYYKRLGYFVNATDITSTSVVDDSVTDVRGKVNSQVATEFVQRGTTGSIGATSDLTLTFPVTFTSSSSYNIVFNPIDSSGNSQAICTIKSKAAASCVIRNNNGASITAEWIAIGT